MKLSRLGFLAMACAAGAAYAQGPGNEPEAENWSGPGTTIPAIARSGDPISGLPDAVRRQLDWLDDTVSLNASDGSLRGYAPRYEVAFGDRRVDFLPMTGIESDSTISLGLELESIRRSGGTPLQIQQGDRIVDGQRVRYRRPDFDEIYDVRKAALEQSFEFRSLPSGTGDLVVRVRASTDMVPSTDQWTEDGLELHLDGVRGHAWIGEVTGIDANGRTVRGSMRFASGALELALPGAFVDSASLPLVLDPFIGAAFEGSAQGTSFDQRDPDVAYDASTDVWCIVWEREVGGTFQIRARGVDSSGADAFPLIAVVDSTAVGKFDPRVANVAREDTFAVVWTESNNIRAGGVTTAGAVVNSAGIDVRATTDFEILPDIGGEMTNADDDAIAVWMNLSTNEIEAAQITVTSTLLTSFGYTNITTLSGGGGTGDALPSISKSGGSTGYHLITYQRTLVDLEIRAMIVNRNLGVIEDFIAVTSNSVQDLDATCDGDGRNWVIGWERDETGTTVDQDIYCVPVHLSVDGTAGYLGGPEVAVEADQNDDEQNVAIAWLGESVLVGFADETSPTSSIYDGTVIAIDPFTCERIGNEILVEASSLDQDFVAIASAASGGSDDDTALVVWDEEDNSTGDSTIRARFWDADEGVVTQEGGGCGAGGEAFATSIDDGNSAFQHRLRFAEAGATCALIFSLDRIDATCGGCTLVPDPFSGIGIGTSTNLQGNAAVAMPIPASAALVGLVFYDQWLVASAAPACSVVNVDFSDAIAVEIQ